MQEGGFDVSARDGCKNRNSDVEEKEQYCFSHIVLREAYIVMTV